MIDTIIGWILSAHSNALNRPTIELRIIMFLINVVRVGVPFPFGICSSA